MERRHLRQPPVGTDPGWWSCRGGCAGRQRAAHGVGLCSEDVLNFNAHAHQGFRPVAALRLLGQRLARLALAVDVAFQFPGAQLVGEGHRPAATFCQGVSFCRRAATRLIYLAIRGFVKDGRNVREWFAARNQFAMMSGGRVDA